MTGPSPDLDALREKAEAIIAAEGQFMSGYEARRIELAFQNAWTPERCLAVLALVDEQRAENERLREYVEANEELERELGLDEGAYLRYRAARAALAGSPAANEEQQCPACRGSGFHKRMLGRQIVHTPCDKCTGTGKA